MFRSLSAARCAGRAERSASSRVTTSGRGRCRLPSQRGTGARRAPSPTAIAGPTDSTRSELLARCSPGRMVAQARHSLRARGVRRFGGSPINSRKRAASLFN
jgi:hypothetical protein